MRMFCAALAAVALTTASPATAAIITLNFNGVANVTGLPPEILGATAYVVGTISFDGAATAYQSGPYGNGSSAYYRPVSGQFVVDGETFTFGAKAAANVLDQKTTDYVSFFDRNTLSGPTLSGYTPWYLSVQFRGIGPLAGPDLPDSRDAFAGISPSFELYFNGPGETQYLARSVKGTFAPAVKAPPVVAGVPEPATWAMMILGFGAAGSLIRRQRRVAAIAEC
jgi:hypothetical protein